MSYSIVLSSLFPVLGMSLITDFKLHKLFLFKFLLELNPLEIISVTRYLLQSNLLENITFTL